MKNKFNCYNSCNCCKQYMNARQMLNICRNEYQYFFYKANVVAVGVGYKTISGMDNLELCIKVFVSEKVSNGELSPQELIPPVYQGFKTDVIESGIVKPMSYKRRIRPTIGGYSIGPASVKFAGSIGGLVTDGIYNYILSNNHVLANENGLPLGSVILQPGVTDGGKIATDIVGYLDKYIPLRYISSSNTPENYADCALAKLIEPSIATAKIEAIGIPKGIRNAKLGKSVQKSGRTTGHTKGKIVTIGTTTTIRYDKGDALFKNQIVTTDMSKEGDSGSLLLDLDKYVVGLIASGTKTFTFVNPIEYVLDNLHVMLVTK